MKRAEETRGDLPRIVNFLLSIGINNSTTHGGELKNLSDDAPKLYFFLLQIRKNILKWYYSAEI